MPDPVTGELTPEATATPEKPPLELTDNVVSALKEAGVDPGRLTQFLDSESGYHKQAQRRMQETAETASAIKEVGESLAATFRESLGAGKNPPSNDATPDPIPHTAYAKAYGIEHPEDWKREVTHEQVWDVVNRLARDAMTRFSGIQGTLPEGVESAQSLGEIMLRLDAVETSANTSGELTRMMLTDGTMTEVAQKYPHAREGDVQEAIKNAPLSSIAAFSEHVTRAAKLSHDEVAGKIEAAELAERKKHIPEAVHLGGEGGAVIGERSGAPAWSPQWVREKELAGEI